MTSNFADITYQDGVNTFTYTNAVEFREDHTPIVGMLSRTTGDVFGGYNLTLNGDNLNFEVPTVTIDGQPCTVLESTATEVVCNVSSRFALP